MLFSRRVAFGILVLVSQLLLVALAAAWCVHMALIAKYKELYFVEPDYLILIAEIIACTVIILLASFVFVLQCRRLFEKRRDDREKFS